MAITYEYKIKSLATGTERINKQEFPNTVRAIIWDLVGTDENGNTKELKDVTTFIQLKTRHTGSFIAFNTLGERDIHNFLESATNMDEHKDSIVKLFNENPNAEPQPIQNEIMPWYFNGKSIANEASGSI
jgi:hypothetical protein